MSHSVRKRGRESIHRSGSCICHLIVYVPITRLLTGERAEMNEEAMMFEVSWEARKEMLIAGLKKAINPKDTNLGFWKNGQEHVLHCIQFTIYKILMLHRAK
jgi:hypothetical protein